MRDLVCRLICCHLRPSSRFYAQFYSLIQKRVRVSDLLAQIQPQPAPVRTAAAAAVPAPPATSALDSMHALRAQLAAQNAALSTASSSSSAVAAHARGTEIANDSMSVLMSRTAALKQKLAAVPAVGGGADAPAPPPSSGFSSESRSLQATLQRLQALQGGTR